MTVPTGSATANVVLSPADLERVERVERLARSGAVGVPDLLELLVDPSWAVRRAVVGALATAGELAAEGLCDILVNRRDHEARLAASVDALVASRSAIEPRLIALAGSDVAAATVCDVLHVLGRRRTRAAVPIISRLASHADDNVAVSAIEALASIGGVDTVDALVASIDARHFFRTFPAIDALGRTGDARALDSLAALLADPLYAAEAARALGRTGQESAVAPLAGLLSSDAMWLVRSGAVALAELRERYEATFGESLTIQRSLAQRLSGPDASRHLALTLTPGVAPGELAAVAVVLGWLGDDIAIEQLARLVAHEAPVSAVAAEALRGVGSRATPHLLAALRHADSALRLKLLPVISLAAIRTAVAPATQAGGLDDLLLCLDDPLADVRVCACDALARLGNPAAVKALFRLIGDHDGRVSQTAAGAIQSLGSIETKGLALALARSSDKRTRRAALRIVSYFGFPEGLGVLIEAMADDDDKIREAAIYGLPLIDDPRGTEALLEATRHAVPRTRSAVMRALGQTTSAPAVVAALQTALGDSDAWVRYYACQALGRLRVEAACNAIIALLNDASGQVRIAAVEALTYLSDECASEALALAAQSSDSDIQRAALVGLGMAKRPGSLAALREAASAPDAATRLVAIAALSGLHGPEVVATLARAASDPEEAVRNAAIGYLSAREGPDATAALLDQLSNPLVRWRVLEALTVDADGRVEGVLATLATADADFAPLLVAALTRMGRPRSQAAIESALGFDNVHARRGAASALAAIGTTEAHRALAKAAVSDADPDVRRISAAVART